MKNDISVRYANLPTTISGYTVQTFDGYTTIILNARCSHDKNIETYLHELNHIEAEDFDCCMPADLIECMAHKED